MDRVVLLFDELGEKQDKFATKPANSQVRYASLFIKKNFIAVVKN